MEAQNLKSPPAHTDGTCKNVKKYCNLIVSVIIIKVLWFVFLVKHDNKEPQQNKKKR